MNSYHAIAAGMDMGIVNPATSVTYADLPQELLALLEDVILCRRPDAAELQDDMLAKVTGRDIYCFPVPSHTRFRIFIANGLVAMRVACYISIG